MSLGGAAATADLNAIDAVEAAAAGLDLADPSGLRIVSGGGASAEAVVSSGGISNAPIPAKLGWQPTNGGLRLAWQVTIDDATDISLWNAAVDAGTGELLDVVDWTIQDEHEDLAASVTGGSLPAPPLVTPDALGFSLNRVLDGSSYRVYDIARESPNDGRAGWSRTRRTRPPRRSAGTTPTASRERSTRSRAETTRTRSSSRTTTSSPTSGTRTAGQGSTSTSRPT